MFFFIMSKYHFWKGNKFISFSIFTLSLSLELKWWIYMDQSLILSPIGSKRQLSQFFLSEKFVVWHMWWKKFIGFLGYAITAWYTSFLYQFSFHLPVMFPVWDFLHKFVCSYFLDAYYVFKSIRKVKYLIAQTYIILYMIRLIFHSLKEV